MKEKKEEKESKLNIFAEAVKVFGAEVEQRRKNLGTPPPSKDESKLIKSGFLKGEPLYGYSLKEEDTDLFIKATYNLHVILARLARNIGNFDLVELGKNAIEIQKGLMEALNAIIKSDVVDESTAQMIKACGQLVVQNQRIIQRIQEKEGGRVSGIIPSVLQSFAGGEEGMKTIDEVTPLTVQALETLFDIAERRYQVEKLSEKIQTFKDGNLPLHNEIRQDLIKVLPNKFHNKLLLEDPLDETFFIQYQEKWNDYLKDLNKIEIGKLALLGDELAILENFLGKRESFENSSLVFLTEVTKLGARITTPVQEPKVEEPIEKEVSAKDVTIGLEKEKSLSELTEKAEETASPPTPIEIPVLIPIPETQKFEETEVSTTPIEKPVKELSWDIEQLREMIEESNRTLKEQENKIKEQEGKIQTLDIRLNELDSELRVLSSDLDSFTIESKRLLTQKEQLLEKSDRLKKWLEQEEPAEREKLPKRQMDLATQRDRIKELREDIRANKLALDSETHKNELAWLGLTKEGLKDYLDAQEQETAFFGGARATAANWWKSARGEKVKPAINYKATNAKLLETLDNADKSVIMAQKKLEKQVELLNQQMIENQKQLEALNIPLGTVEKEIETLNLKILEKTTLKTQVENDKKQAENNKKEAEGKKAKLEAANKELLEWRGKLVEQEKLVQQKLAEQHAEEEKKKLEAEQLKKTRQLEQAAKEAKEESVENPPEKIVASALKEPEPATFSTTITTDKELRGAEEERRAQTPKERYNDLRQKYEDATGWDNRFFALLAWIKEWFAYQQSKAKQALKIETPSFPPSPVIFLPSAKVSPENVKMPENQKQKKSGPSTQ